MARKVIAGQELRRFRGTVAKKLAAWQHEHGYDGKATERRSAGWVDH